MTLDLSLLPNTFPRQYLPATADMGDWAQVEPLYAELETRAVDTVEQLERWLVDWSELSAALYQEISVRYIRMTCQTDDAAAEQAYLHIIEAVQPRAKQADNRLDRKYATSPARLSLPLDQYGILDRKIENQVALFRDENVPLETEEAKLAQRYEKVTGAMTVQFDGREQTLPQMARYLEMTDREQRQAAWEAAVARGLRDRAELDQIYADLIALRHQIARNAGFDDYRDYAFRLKERFDYTPEHCETFHAAVEANIVPLMRDLHARRRRALGVEALRPWDLAVDPHGRPPLRPFDGVERLVAGCAAIFDRVEPELAGQFRMLADLGLLDLESRKGKAPGGYQAMLAERRLPFIFMNAAGRKRDVRTLLHEAGHAFHAFATQPEPLLAYRHAPTEFSEVASMTMELLGGEHMDVFYEAEDAARARHDHLEGIVRGLAWIATIDAFQHWVYTHPAHTPLEREAYWLELRRRFGGLVDWDGYADAQRSAWQRQLHLYVVPFYYIEYGIAQLGALGVWRNARHDGRAALNHYRQALALGGSRPLPDLFAAAGVRFDFGTEIVAQVVDELRLALA